MCVIVTPISSMWPRSASVGAPSPRPTRANDVPSVSVVTSANADAACRQIFAGASSCPDGPGAVSSDCKSSGSAIGLRIQPGVPTLAADELHDPDLVGLAHRAGREPARGSLEPAARQPAPLDPTTPLRVVFR